MQQNGAESKEQSIQFLEAKGATNSGYCVANST